jgi:hypothetical protein
MENIDFGVITVREDENEAVLGRLPNRTTIMARTRRMLQVRLSDPFQIRGK